MIKQYIFRYGFIFSCTLFLFGCAFKKYTQKANTYEQAGAYPLAIENYMKALSKKPTYIDAQIGLQRSGLQYVDQLQQQIENAYNANNDNEVVDTYTQLNNLVQKSGKYNIFFNIAQRTQGQYQESKERYLLNHYQEGQQFLEEEKFADAAKAFELVLQQDKNYCNTLQQYTIAVAEPFYRNAKTAIAEKKFRTAFAFLNQVINIDAQYKDSKTLQQQTIDDGKITIAFLPTEYYDQHKIYIQNMIAQTQQNIIQLNNPFIQMVSPNFEEQQISQQKEILKTNPNYNVRIVPLRNGLQVRIKINKYQSNPTENNQKGFLVRKYKDTTIYKKIYYKEYTKKQSIQIEMPMEIVDIKIQNKVFFNSFKYNFLDEIRYITLHQTPQKEEHLFAGYWEEPNTNFDTNKDRLGANIDTLLNTPKKLKTEEEIQKELGIRAGNFLYQQIVIYNNTQK